jgi:hypothetical protein
LTIAAADIVSMKDGPYTLQVTVTNFLGVMHTTTADFIKLPAGKAPVISVPGGNQQTFKLSQGVQLTAQLLATSVCAGKKVSKVQACAKH